jgi:hypothetical protein
MLRFLADEDFGNRILRGLLRRLPELDVIRVQDIGLREEPDPVVLEWAAAQDRIVLTYDVNTMPAHAYARLDAGLSIAGVCVVAQSAPIGPTIEELLLIAQCCVRADWENQVRYLPL